MSVGVVITGCVDGFISNPMLNDREARMRVELPRFFDPGARAVTGQPNSMLRRKAKEP